MMTIREHGCEVLLIGHVLCHTTFQIQVLHSQGGFLAKHRPEGRPTNARMVSSVLGILDYRESSCPVAPIVVPLPNCHNILHILVGSLHAPL